MRGPPRVTLFPYTTLFRSHGVAVRECAENLGDALDWRDAGGRSPLQRPAERDVPLMAGPKGHDIGVQPSTEEREVSEKVCRLVPHKLVRPVEGRPNHVPVGEHDRRPWRRTLGQALGAELPHVL